MRAVTRLYREARRRKVFRSAALYVVGAWAVLQAAALSFPGFGIPEAAIRAAIWAAVLGFLVALIFGWLFEIDSRAASAGRRPPPPGRPRNLGPWRGGQGRRARGSY